MNCDEFAVVDFAIACEDFVVACGGFVNEVVGCSRVVLVMLIGKQPNLSSQWRLGWEIFLDFLAETSEERVCKGCPRRDRIALLWTDFRRFAEHLKLISSPSSWKKKEASHIKFRQLRKSS